MNIGVDFGTTYTKIAYLDDDARLTLFEYPKGSSSRNYIPTAVSYRHGHAPRTFKIGKAAKLNRLKFEEEKVEQDDPDEFEETWELAQNDPEKRSAPPPAVYRLIE